MTSPDQVPLDDDELMGRMIAAARTTCSRLSPTGWHPPDVVVGAMIGAALRTARQMTEMTTSRKDEA